MATTKVSGELVDLRGGLPDFSLAATNTVSYLNAGGGNQYNFNGAYGLYGVVNGTFVLSSVSSSHPIAILNNGKTSLISYTGAVNEGSQTGPDGNTYTYYSGDVTITVSGNFDVVSYACKIHGYMGGQNNLIYTNLHSELGLKIPTGTNTNRPATDVAGMIRNNTNEASEGSASCEEYYNGAAWKKINNVPPPPPLAFKTVLYAGNGSSNSITGLGFQPDWVWIKQRDTAVENHNLYDSSRGVRNFLTTNNNAANVFGSAQRLNAFDSDGFTIGSDNEINDSGSNYVAWCWKANGGTTSSNTDGSVTSTVQPYAEAGFSIVQWSGTGSASTIGHGLGITPELIIAKSTSGTGDWQVYVEPLGNGNKLVVNSTGGSSSTTRFDSTSPTTSVFTFNNSGLSTDQIAYCFASVAGYSKIGSYTGNGNTGQSITGLGFSPNFLMIKITDATDNWVILDSVRGGTNILAPNSTAQEYSESGVNITFDSDGFSLSGSGAGQGQVNGNGNSYIYMAFLTA